MKTFWGFLKKEFIHIFRDKRTLFVVLLIPIIQILIFGFVINNEIKNVNVAILDYSNDRISHQVINKINSSEYFQVTKHINSTNEIDEIFKYGNINVVLVFENDFAKNINASNGANLQLIIDGSNPSTAQLISTYINSIVAGFVKEKNVQVSFVGLNPKPQMWYNKNLESSFMFIPGTAALILMLITAMLSSISIVKEKEIGTMELLLLSPIKPSQIIIGKVLPYVLISIANAFTVILLGKFIFGIPIHGSYFLLALVSLEFILVALCLGIFISTIAKNQMTAMFVSIFALMLPTMLLSGFIFPIENMPKVLQYISFILPPRYFLEAIKDIMLKGVGIEHIWRELLVLLGMSMLLIIVSIKKFKIRLS